MILLLIQFGLIENFIKLFLALILFSFGIFGIFAATFFAWFLVEKIKNKVTGEKTEPVQMPIIEKSPTAAEIAERKTAADLKRRENHAAIEEFQKLIKKWSIEKNIDVRFVRNAGTGHADYPELWHLAKPIPLAPNELYELIKLRKAVETTFVTHADGIVYAHYFYYEYYDRVEYQISPDYSELG